MADIFVGHVSYQEVDKDNIGWIDKSNVLEKKSIIHVVKTRAKFISRLLDMWNTAFPYSDLKGFRLEGLSPSLEEKKQYAKLIHDNK